MSSGCCVEELIMLPTVVSARGSVAELNRALYQVSAPVMLLMHESVRLGARAISSWAAAVAKRQGAVVASLRERTTEQDEFCAETWRGSADLEYGPRVPKSGVRAMRNLDRFRWEALGIWREQHQWAGGFDDRYGTHSFVVGVDYAHRLRGSHGRVAVSAEVPALIDMRSASCLAREVEHAAMFYAHHGHIPARPYWKQQARAGRVRLGRSKVTLLEERPLERASSNDRASAC